MHLTDFPDNASGVCLLTGTAADPEGFVNTELPTDPKRLGNPAIVSVGFVRELGEQIGMISAADVQDLYNQISGLKLEAKLLEAEREQFKAEAEAMYTLAGPKLWAKAQHIRKNAGFDGRRKIEAIQKFAKDEITQEEFDEKLGVNEEELCSTAS